MTDLEAITMPEALSELGTYLNLPFVQRALAAGILVSLCASLLGVPLVLRRFSFVGDGLSHVAFGAMAVAAAAGFAAADTPIVLAVTVFCAVLLLKGGERAEVKGDASLAMLSAGALALGYLAMNAFPPSSNVSGDVCSTLFGSASILTLAPSDVWLCFALSTAVIAFFVLFHNKIFAITFDEEFAAASGMKTGSANTVAAVLVAVVVVLAMRLVGALLVSALVVFPALSAMRLFKSFRAVTVAAAAISAFCATAGLLVSIVADTPSGATVVATDMLAFLLASTPGMAGGRRRT